MLPIRFDVSFRHLTDACALPQVHLFGGCVTSWKQASGDEVLYIRPDAKFDGSKPISGGIPHCFPQVQSALRWGRLTCSCLQPCLTVSMSANATAACP